MADSSIPVIDISTHSPETAQRVLSAATTHGFLFIANDGVTIPPKDIDEMFSLVSLPHLSLVILVFLPLFPPLASSYEDNNILRCTS
jgi:hypothetical protein